MKTLRLLSLCALGLPLNLLSQGQLMFDNVTGNALVTISTIPGMYNPADGLPGAYVGSDYTASLYYLSGTITNQAIFDSSSPILYASADTPFLGTTGFDPSNGAGEFAYGVVYLPVWGLATVEVRAWYNGGGAYTSYGEALAAGRNVGESNPIAVYLPQGAPPPATLDGMLPFTVGIVPEPSTLTLFGLGGLSLWLFRRRKYIHFIR